MNNRYNKKSPVRNENHRTFCYKAKNDYALYISNSSRLKLLINSACFVTSA